ncbi:Ca2+-binding protein [Nostoc sphaeroides CCNUC1]|uniref:Ca2+-binding protein n=1 Tax=Nostoc sphaeroides CCNUC1 TaxID=2653204 RepID=A0A5P8W6X4_9NOSO|nr:Ca2+-binding protein [Nostoc sphaeroides CCNUC1]
MEIQGFGISACLGIPVVLSLLTQGERIKESLVKNVHQVSTNKEISLSNRELISANSKPKTYYVSGSGNNGNNGLSTSSAFRTIQKAADLTNPGDTVLIMNGVYKNASPNGNVLSITRSGKVNAWIRYKAYSGHLPKIQHNGWNGILISNGASYIEINGLEIIGNNANITLDYAMSQKNNRRNPLTSGNCISVNAGKNGRSHHLRIVNNKVHDCGGGGIGTSQSDYVTIDNNVVFNNAWYSVYGNSGISMLNNWNSDNNRGYKMFVTNNKSYNNRMYIPWIAVGKITDGNGIIIDSSTNKQKNLKLSAYTGRTLVKNNLTFNNGGSGIHTFISEHIDIVNNTAVLNNQSPEIKDGQIFANNSSNVRILRNILYAFPGKVVNSNFRNKNVTYDYNIYLNSSKIAVKGPNDVVADSEFLSKHPTIERIFSNWKSKLDKQNPPTRTNVESKSASLVCEPMTYTLQSKPIQVGCSSTSLAQTTASPSAQTTAFSDVSSNYWAAQFIQQLSGRGVIAGFPDGSFRPEEAVTRAQFAAMVNKAFQKPAQRQAINFADVPSNYWASSAIQQAYTIGFLSGYPGNRFEPNQAIPRQQVLVSLANGLGYSSGGNNESTLRYFNDASKIASYARSPIAAATEKQIVVNYPNVKSLNPTATATRAQVAAFIYQALVSSNQAPAINSPYVVSNPSN